MIGFVIKATRLNLRIADDFREELQTLADYRGLTLSALAHSLLVKSLRKEKQAEPEAFTELHDRKVSNKKQTVSVLKEKIK